MRDRSAEDWEALARSEPHFAVLTDERFLEQRLTPEALRAFFDTGEHDVRFLFELIGRYLGRALAPRSVLDFGCGTGRLTLALASRGEAVFGVDVAPTMLELARRHGSDAGLTNIEFASDLDSLPDVSFDLICSLIVFQHLPVGRGEAILKELLARLRPGGVAALHFTIHRPGGRFRRVARKLRAAFPPVHRFLQVLRRERLRLPYMQMNEYDPDRILAIIRAAGCREPLIEETNHGGIAGAIFVTVKRGDQ